MNENIFEGMDFGPLKEYLENEWLEWKDVTDEWTRSQAIEDKNILDFVKDLEYGRGDE